MKKTLYTPLAREATSPLRCREVSGWELTLDETSARVWQLLVLNNAEVPTFVDTHSYLRHQKNNLDRWLGDAAYLESSSPIAWLPLRAWVIRRKTKISKLLKKLGNSSSPL